MSFLSYWLDCIVFCLGSYKRLGGSLYVFISSD